MSDHRFRAADQAFINAACKLYGARRRNKQLPDVLNAVTGNDPWLALVAPEISDGDGAVDLSITPDCNESRDTVFEDVTRTESMESFCEGWLCITNCEGSA